MIQDVVTAHGTHTSESKACTKYQCKSKADNLLHFLSKIIFFEHFKTTLQFPLKNQHAPSQMRLVFLVKMTSIVI